MDFRAAKPHSPPLESASQDGLGLQWKGLNPSPRRLGGGVGGRRNGDVQADIPALNQTCPVRPMAVLEEPSLLGPAWGCVQETGRCREAAVCSHSLALHALSGEWERIQPHENRHEREGLRVTWEHAAQHLPAQGSASAGRTRGPASLPRGSGYGLCKPLSSGRRHS